MLVSLAWLREFTPYEGDVQTLADRLTMLGLEAEGIHNPFAEIMDVVVGHVVTREQHPEADKLSVCRVDVGGEVLQIVCGAPNVAAGQNVPVGKVGTTLPGGLTLKKAKLRGIESHGMICSERELGLSEDHSGIMVLPESFTPGQPLHEALNLDTCVLEIGITPNRADCLSILGVAREVALAFGLPLTMPELNLREAASEYGDARDQWTIDVADGELCPLYQARVIENVKVGPSPAWMRYRLLAMGQRPISNIVDVTNYVMFELGHPLHAFDRELLEGGRIRVAPAADGMKFTTLDNQERALTGDDLLIWDGKKPVGLAGVMGGANSEMHDGSTNVVLECAVFRPATIRKTGRRLGLSSEAGYRFERGVNQVLARFCIDRAAALVAEVAGGSVLSGVAASEPKPWKEPRLPFRRERCEKLLGVGVGDEFCRKTLGALGCQVKIQDGAWDVGVPPWRGDLEREVDLVEEIGRVYGVDRIPTVLPKVSKSLDVLAGEETVFAFASRIKHWARGAGLAECINFSFCGTKDLNLLGEPQEGRIPVANPLTEEQDVMRTVLAPGLLANLRQNLAHGSPDVRLFEVAKRFYDDPASETTAHEELTLAMLLHGRRHPGFPCDREALADYADLKGLVENLLGHLGLGEPSCVLVQDHPWLQPCVGVSASGEHLGLMGMVRGEVADDYDARFDVWTAELDLAVLEKLWLERSVAFKALPTYPPVKRDLTLVCPAGLPVAEVLAAVKDAGVALLEDAALIDEFVPEGAGERNLTFRMVYRHAAKTLTDKDADKAHAKVTSFVMDKLGVKLQ